MDALTPVVTQDMFNLFHAIDRALYSTLVMELWRDPVECMQIMAFWLWLEELGYCYVVNKIRSLPSVLINGLADEAIICLNCINYDQFPALSELPLIQRVLEKEISLKFFRDNRLSATKGVAKYLNEVCAKVFSDIMQKAINRNATQSIINSQKFQNQVKVISFQPSFVQPRVVLPPLEMIPEDVVLSWTQETEVPVDDRTMFVTFSKGYPVQESEIREFLAKSYGDCVESLHMQEVEPNEQSLFARIVFKSPATIESILNGQDKAKFTINGKHVWARKFVPKNPKTFLPSSFPPSYGMV